MKNETKPKQTAPDPSYFTAYHNGDCWLFGLKKFDSAAEAKAAMHNRGEIVMVSMAARQRDELVEALEIIERQIEEVKSHGDYFAQALRAQARQAIASVKGEK